MTIRLRLATWYGLSLLLALAIVGSVVWLWYSSELHASMAAAVRTLADDSRQAADQGTTPAVLVTEDLAPDQFVAVFGRTGRLAASRGTPADLPAPVLAERWIDVGSGPIVVTAVRSNAGETIVAGASLARLRGDLGSLARTLGEAGGVVLLFAVVGGWWLSGRALAPVDALTREAAAIGTSDLRHRLREPRRRDELARLARTLNDMLGRVEAAVKRERSFIASASHDLRTPISALLVELELAVGGPADPELLMQAVAAAHQDATRLARITDELLELARVEASGSPLRLESIAVDVLVEAALERVRPEASSNDVVVESDAPGVLLWIDGVRVEQALVNLLTNALRHGRGPVLVTARISAAGDGSDTATPAAGARQELAVEVTDHGPGVDDELSGRLFEPFSRGRGMDGGIGLGLATAAAAVRAHGGSIGYRQRPGGGACFWFRIPAEPVRSQVVQSEAQRLLRRTVHGRGTGRSRVARTAPATYPAARIAVPSTRIGVGTGE